MRFRPIKTRKFLPPKDDLYELLDDYLPRLKERDILMITSKILGIHQGRCVKIKTDSRAERDRLVRKEADRYILRKHVPHEYAFLAIKYHALLPSAGIDKSNSMDYYVLLPKNVNKLLREVWTYLRRKHKIKNLGVVAVDSHSMPLRYGTIGVSIGLYGFEPVIDYRGKEDLFGRKLKVTRSNVVDSLAATTVMLMGESSEQTPLLIVRGVKKIQFTEKSTQRKLVIPLEEDMYYPILKLFRKKTTRKRGKHKK